MADHRPEWLISAGAADPPEPASRQGWERLDWHESDAPDEEPASRRPSARVLAVTGLSIAVLLLIAAVVAVAVNRDEQPSAPAEARERPAADPGAGTAPPARTVSASITFVRPGGWVDRTRELADRLSPQEGVTAERVLIGPSSAGVPAHIVVTKTRVPDRQRSLDVLRQDFMVGMRVRNPSAEPIGSPIYLEVAGVPATSFEFRYQQRDVGVASRAVIVNRDGNAYLVLFETGEVDYDMHVNALWELLESWRWR